MVSQRMPGYKGVNLQPPYKRHKIRSACLTTQPDMPDVYNSPQAHLIQSSERRREGFLLFGGQETHVDVPHVHRQGRRVHFRLSDNQPAFEFFAHLCFDEVRMRQLFENFVLTPFVLLGQTCEKMASALYLENFLESKLLLQQKISKCSRQLRYLYSHGIFHFITILIGYGLLIWGV